MPLEDEQAHRRRHHEGLHAAAGAELEAADASAALFSFGSSSWTVRLVGLVLRGRVQLASATVHLEMVGCTLVAAAGADLAAEQPEAPRGDPAASNVGAVAAAIAARPGDSGSDGGC